jgi:hypothetical protein
MSTSKHQPNGHNGRTAFEQDNLLSSAYLTPIRTLLCFQSSEFRPLVLLITAGLIRLSTELWRIMQIAAISSATVCTRRLVWTDPELNAVSARPVNYGARLPKQHCFAKTSSVCPSRQSNMCAAHADSCLSVGRSRNTTENRFS